MADNNTWPKELGEHNLGEQAIARIEEKGEKVRWLFVVGYKQALKAWASDVKNLGEGEKFNCTIEVKENQYNGETQIENWFKPPRKSRGGGGGGRGYTPKTQAEIHAPSVAGIIKTAIEVGGADRWKGLAEEGIKLYAVTLKAYDGAVAK